MGSGLGRVRVQIIQQMRVLNSNTCRNHHVTLDDAKVAEREQTAPPHALEGLEPVAHLLHHLDGVVEAFCSG